MRSERNFEVEGLRSDMQRCMGEADRLEMFVVAALLCESIEKLDQFTAGSGMPVDPNRGQGA